MRDPVLSHDEAAAFRVQTWRKAVPPLEGGTRLLSDYLHWLAAQNELHRSEAPDMGFDDFLRMRFHQDERTGAYA